MQPLLAASRHSADTNALNYNVVEQRFFMSKRIILVLVVAMISGQCAYAKGPSEKKASGEQLFKQHCSSCHIGGSNSVKESKPVAGSKELITIIKFKNYLSSPPGHMPYYQNLVNDPKLLKALYSYCKTLKVTATKT